MNTLSDKSNLRQIAVISAILIMGLLLFFTLRSFLSSFLGAIMFFVLFRPMMIRLSVKGKWKKHWASLFILLISFLIFLLPLSLIVWMVVKEVSHIQGAPEDLLAEVQALQTFLLDKYGIQIAGSDTLEKLRNTILEQASGFLNQTFVLAGQISLMYFMLYYMLQYQQELADFAWKNLPFKQKSNTRLFIGELKSQTYSNSMVVPLLAISQGIIAGIGFWIFQVPDPWFWGIITGFFSIIPVVGTAIIWIPAGILLLINQQWWQGAGLLAYGGLVISNIDNVFRFILQKRFADVHPLITVFGVIAGLDLFGLPGLIFGPLLISYFIILIKVYRSEYLSGESAQPDSVAQHPEPWHVDNAPTEMD